MYLILSTKIPTCKISVQNKRFPKFIKKTSVSVCISMYPSRYLFHLTAQEQSRTDCLYLAGATSNCHGRRSATCNSFDKLWPQVATVTKLTLPAWAVLVVQRFVGAQHWIWIWNGCYWVTSSLGHRQWPRFDSLPLSGRKQKIWPDGTDISHLWRHLEWEYTLRKRYFEVSFSWLGGMQAHDNSQNMIITTVFSCFTHFRITFSEYFPVWIYTHLSMWIMSCAAALALIWIQ